MRPTDIVALRSISALDLTADHAVLAQITHPDLASDTNVSTLRSYEPGDRQGRLLTRGPHDREVSVSPDGRLVAFLRPHAAKPLHADDTGSYDDAPQLHVADVRGGEAMVVTALPLGVTRFVWLPDSSGFVVAAPIPQAERYRADIAPTAEPPRTLPPYMGRANGAGYVYDRPTQLAFVPCPDVHADVTYAPTARAKARGIDEVALPEVTALTEGEVSYQLHAISPDGSYVLATAADFADADRKIREDLFAIALPLADDPHAVSHCARKAADNTDLAGRPHPPLRITGTAQAGASIHVNIDAAQLSVGGDLWLLATDLGASGTDFVGKAPGLHFVAASDLTEILTGDAPCLFTAEHNPAPLTDQATLELHGPLIAAGDTALATALERGSNRLVRAHRSGAIDFLTPLGQIVGPVAYRDGAIAYGYSCHNSFGEIALLEAGDESPTQLTCLGAPLRAVGISTPIEREYRSADDYPVHGWVVKPAGEGPYPLVLMIHGGPHASYGPALFDEAQVLANHGIGVAMCNPRGSAGYGYDHARSVRHRLGTIDMADVLAFLEGTLAEFDCFDHDRLGIMGGSYGGYLTAFTIAHDHRFRAAIVERGYLDPQRFVGPSDIGWFFSPEYVGTDAGEIAKQSPQAHADQVTTPTLVLHSEEDLRCPLDQALHYYTTLINNGVEATTLIFPGENHELSRSGGPWHRVERFEAILSWWDRHLLQDR